MILLIFIVFDEVCEMISNKSRRRIWKDCCWESTIRDVTARNLDALRSTVNVSKPTFFVLKIANAWIVRILKEVKRGKLSFMETTPTI